MNNRRAQDVRTLRARICRGLRLRALATPYARARRPRAAKRRRVASAVVTAKKKFLVWRLTAKVRGRDARVEALVNRVGAENIHSYGAVLTLIIQGFWLCKAPAICSRIFASVNAFVTFLDLRGLVFFAIASAR